MLYEDGLDRESAVFTFISDNQGCNIRDVITQLEMDKISSKKTTIKIIKHLEEMEWINISNSPYDGREKKLYLNNDNQMAKLRFKIHTIQRSFDVLVMHILNDKNDSTLHSLNIEYNIKVKIISLISSILKLFTTLIHEILTTSSTKIRLKNKDYLHEQYRYFQSKISDMLVSFNRLTERLDETSLEYVNTFAKRNDTPIKTFLWSILLFYETRMYPPYFIYKKEFKTALFHTMKLLYNLGKKYSASFYDELVCDNFTYNNNFCTFPNARYMRPLRTELKKLEYNDFIKLLLERGLLLENFKYSSPGQLLTEIERSKKNLVQNIDNYKPSIFENIILNVNDQLYQNYTTYKRLDSYS